jgi:hypothetical protein
VGEKVYDIPNEGRQLFVADFPQAIYMPSRGFDIGGKKYNIPIDKVAEFANDFPQAIDLGVSDAPQLTKEDVTQHALDPQFGVEQVPGALETGLARGIETASAGYIDPYDPTIQALEKTTPMGGLLSIFPPRSEEAVATGEEAHPIARTVGDLIGFGISLTPLTRATAFMSAGKNAPFLARLAINSLRGLNIGGMYGTIEKLPEGKGRLENIVEEAAIFGMLDGGFTALGKLALPVLKRLFKSKNVKQADKVISELPEDIQKRTKAWYDNEARRFWENPKTAAKLNEIEKELTNIENLGKTTEGKKLLEESLAQQQELLGKEFKELPVPGKETRLPPPPDYTVGETLGVVKGKPTSKIREEKGKEVLIQAGGVTKEQYAKARPKLKKPIGEDVIGRLEKEKAKTVELAAERVDETLKESRLRLDEFIEGIFTAAKKDIKSKRLGVTANPFKETIEFLEKHDLKSEDKQKIKNFIGKVMKARVLSDIQKQQKIKDYLQKNYGEFSKEPIIVKGSVPKVSEKIISGKIKFARGGAEVQKMYERSFAESKKQHKLSFRKIKNSLVRATVDVSGNIKRQLLKRAGKEGEKVIMEHDLIAGASSKAVKDFNNSAKDIYGKLNEAEKNILDGIIQSRRTVTISKYKDIKHPEGLAPEKHLEWMEQIPKETFTKLNERANLYFKEMENQLTNLYKEGLLNEKSYNALKEKGDYSPRRFFEYLDDFYEFEGKIIRVPTPGIKALKEGSFGLMETDSNLLLSQVIHRTQTRIFRNRANKALYELAQDMPENGIARVWKGKTPPKHSKISVMIDGQKKEMIMPNELVVDWVNKDPILNHAQANIINWISGSKILKPMATGINPEFALTNFPRDIFHAWITTAEHSSHLPVALLQMAGDFKKVTSDVLLRKGRWIDYIDEGGGMEFLTHQGRFGKNLSGMWGKLQSFLGYMGETSEIYTRLALRERAISKGKSSKEATWIARNYLDFSQGGNLAKAADAGMPYLNAAIQGTRGIFRAARQNPKLFTYKMSQLMGFASTLYLANRYVNKEALDQISVRDKVNNWIITTPFSYKDKDGNTRYYYIRIAKDQGQRLVATVMENLMAKFHGEEIDVDQVTQAAADMIPLIPTDVLPPSLDAIYGYKVNKDFWRNEDLWKGPEIDKSYEVSKYTHPAFKELGELSGMSPVRTQYALQQFFTYNNIYTSLTGVAWKQIMDNLPESQKQDVVEQIILKKPFIRRMLKSTDPYYAQQKMLEKTKIDENTKRYKITLEFDELMGKYLNNKKTKDEVKAFIKEQPKEESDRLIRRYRRSLKLKDLPDRRWWLNLSGLSPEARASVYWVRWSGADEEEKAKLEKYKKIAPGIMSQRFADKLRKLKRKSGEVR